MKKKLTGIVVEKHVVTVTSKGRVERIPRPRWERMISMPKALEQLDFSDPSDLPKPPIKRKPRR